MVKTPESNRPITSNTGGTNKQTKDTLHQNGQWHKTILQASMDGFVMTDIQGRLLEVNAAYCRMSGYSEQELLTMSIADLEANETSDDVDKRIQQLIALGEMRFETRHRKKDGTVYDVEVSIQYRSDKGGRLASFLRDITEHKKAETRLAERNQLIESIVNNTPDILYIYDIIEKRNIYSNDGIQKILGYTVEEIQEMGEKIIPLLMHPDDFKEYLQKIVPRYGIARDKEQIIHQYRMKHKNGEWRWLTSNETIYLRHPDGTPKQIFGMTHDITEALAAGESLKKSESLLKAQLDNSPDLIMVLDKEFRFVSINKIVFGFTSYSVKELIGMDAVKILPEKVQTLVRDRIQECFDTGVIQQFEHQISEEKWALARIVPLTIDGVIDQVMVISTDITKRRQAYEELRKLASVVQNSCELVNLAALDGTMTFINEAGAKILGIDMDNLEQVNIMQVIPGHLKEKAETEVLPALKDQGKWQGELQYINLKNGQLTDVYATTFTITDPSTGAPLYLANVSLDITERKKAEVALRDSEERFRKIFEETTLGVVTVLPSFLFEKANPAFCRMLGYTEDELRTMKFTDITHPDYIGHDIEYVKKVRDGEIPFYQVEKQYIHKSGRVIWGNIIVSSIRDKQGAFLYYLCMINDITEHIQDELLLKAKTEEIKARNVELDQTNKELRIAKEKAEYNEKLLKNITDNIPAYIAEVDAKTLKYKFVNLKFLTGFNKKTEEIVGSHISEIIGKSNTEYAMKYINEVRNGNTSSYVNTFNLTEGKRYINVQYVPGFDEKGKVQDIIVLSTDITAMKESEQALQKAKERVEESEEKYRTLIENINAGVFQSTLSGEFLHINDAAAKMAGYGNVEELIAKPTSCLYADPEDQEHMRKILFRDGEIRDAEIRSIKKEGDSYWVSMNAVLQRDKNGHPDKILGIVSDITERKRAEEEKAELETRLIQAQKMESIGRLAGGVAHDFNNMLGVILGNAEMALSEVQPEQPLYSDLIEIKKAAERSADLTRQLLAFARKQTIAPKVLDLNSTITGMLKMLNRLIGENIRLCFQPANELWPVNMDPSQLDQIMVNLCVNAHNAITDVGEVIILTDNIALDAVSCAGMPDAILGEYVRITVRDNGSGMDRETLERIFEPFFTTRSMGAGTGLGLATVYGAVKQNNGFINVESSPNKGTTFEIYLPRSLSKAERAATSESSNQMDEHSRETIMLVEDEPALLSLITRILQKKGYTVLTAATPGAAIQLAREYTGDIQLLITDVIMPEMNGRDLAKNILSLYPNLKRLFMSGYTADVIAHHGVLEEGVFFIQKPLTQKELLDKIQEVLEHT